VNYDVRLPMNNSPTEFHQLGKFIYLFQIVERQIEELIVLLSGADDEMTSILMNELGFYEKLKATDVMFARFIDVRTIDGGVKKEFHQKIDEVVELCKRRNDIVHSKYRSLLNIDGKIGLLRENSKLKPSKGTREETEEELMPEDFTDDLSRISKVSTDLENYRLRIIDWLYPDVSA
jgi:hypothetical protein